MNSYNTPLANPITQTILPVLTMDGRVYGFYPIAEQTFDGTETSYETSDGVIVPLKVVTVDYNPGLHTVVQYMAATWPIGLSFNLIPWSSQDFVANDQSGFYSWYSLPTQSWIHHFSKGILINSIQSNLAESAYVPPSPTSPDVTDGAMTWRASVSYQMLLGDCSFFDFNWVDVFQAHSDATPIRIQTLTNPAPISPSPVPPMRASVIGNPQATANGVVYNTVRIMKLSDLVPGDYVFTFRVFDDNGNSTDVTFTLTIM